VRRLNRELEGRVAWRTAELQQKNDELKSFAAFLSHELRQPIAAQALWAELLESDHASALGEQGRECVREIRRHVKRAGDLIGAQLAIADVGSAPMEIRIVDLAEVLDELQRELKPDLDAVQASIQWSELPTVEGDRRHLHQLFRNLVENSIKFRRPEAAPQIHVSGTGSDGGVEILYCDNGRGFDGDGAKRIFGEFERLDRSRSDGLGLGLAVCRRIVERHGGTIEAQGDAGRGASFRLLFPPPSGESPGSAGSSPWRRP
jgi:signal transduction histidine kinase